MYGYTCSQRQKNGKKKVILIAACAVLAAMFLICVIYASDYYYADGTALDALVSDGAVEVNQNIKDMIVFSPKNPAVGLIFYPGGKVEYTAYAPLLHELAAQGMLCVLVRMPWNLAVLDIDAAEGIQEMFPEIDSWYIGGHSLGGSMAAGYVAGHAEEYAGLILLAAYSTEDISQSGLDVLSVYGSRDGVLDMEKYTSNLINLPKNMEEYEIEEGCHAQFGSYGTQRGDGIPGIRGEEQREITVRYITEWVNKEP